MKYKLDKTQKRNAERFFRGLADAFAPKDERIGVEDLDVETYEMGLLYGKDMLKDAGDTTLSIGDYVDTALKEMGIGDG